MEVIQPVCAESCAPHIGRPVCVVLNNGTHYYGYLSGVDGGKLYLSESVQGPGTLSVSAVKAKKQLAGIQRKGKDPRAKTKVYPPLGLGYPGYGPGPGAFAGAFALDLALITLLFALPFFLI
jgi:hypothetical protein